MTNSIPLRLAAVAVLNAGDNAPPESTTTIRDSAGITIVENSAPTWTESDAWRLGTAPTIRIGGLDGVPEYELFRVAGARRLHDGRIVVANAGTLELRFYDAEGTYLQSVGREEDGPGKFRGLRLIAAYGSDSIAAFDYRLMRMSISDTDGRFARVVPVRPTKVTGVTVRGVFADGTLAALVVPKYPISATAGRVRLDFVYVPISAGGARADTLGVFPGQESFRHTEAGGGIWSIPFGNLTYEAVRPDRFYSGTTDTVRDTSVRYGRHPAQDRENAARGLRDHGRAVECLHRRRARSAQRSEPRPDLPPGLCGDAASVDGTGLRVDFRR